MKNWPDFLVVGAARAGTTSLQRYLRQHPGLFLPKLKEPCFFSFAGDKSTFKHGKFAFAVRDQKKYLELFEAAEREQVRGEISTPYLYLIKILILRRNPAERAFSQYMWRVRDGREPLSFEDAILQEAKRKQEGYSFDYFYLDRGFYSEQVNAYMKAFPNVKIVLLDDLKVRPLEMLAEICQFLGVDENFEFESRTKFRLLNQLPDSWRQGIREQFRQGNSIRTTAVKLNPETKKKLIELYRSDILELEKLIHRDLSAWLLPG